jgi:surface antigen
MKKIPHIIFALVLGANFLTVASFAQNKCAKYFGKGYCVDYIKNRVGKKQSGDAATWSGNIDPKSVQPGDVAIFNSPAPYGHVAVVERVIYERNTDRPYQVEISEWNWGAQWVDKDCAVTNMFAKQSRRMVRVNIVKAFWRP